MSSPCKPKEWNKAAYAKDAWRFTAMNSYRKGEPSVTVASESLQGGHHHHLHFFFQSHHGLEAPAAAALQADSVVRPTVVALVGAANPPVIARDRHRDEDFREGKTVAGVHPPTFKATLAGTRGARMPSGYHHIAFVCKNMRETINFYEQAMGMKLRAIYPMHGIRGAKHCFLECGNGNELSFVEFNNPIPSMNPPSFFQPWPIGMHHHMAFRCETMDQLLALRDQIKAYGTPVSKIVDHDFINSIYFTDPSGYNLELTHTYRGYTDDEYNLSILDRALRPEENMHEESDKHGKNVVAAPKSPPSSKL
jgi:catechol 2,3-dioxygenase-like lactoylglutathione lyase family enzyme